MPRPLTIIVTGAIAMALGLIAAHITTSAGAHCASPCIAYVTAFTAGITLAPWLDARLRRK